MGISLTSETQQLIEHHMKECGIETADELVQFALRALSPTRGPDIEDLDADTQADIAEGIAQADRGEMRPWAEVKEELRTRYMK